MVSLPNAAIFLRQFEFSQRDRRSGDCRWLLPHRRLLAHPGPQFQTGYGRDGAFRIFVVLE